jgi:hypothetical protein
MIPWLQSPLATPNVNPVNVVLGSDFADQSDYDAYVRAKAEGKSEDEALAVGDNCVGYWGDKTGPSNVPPYIALPPEVLSETWGSIGASHLQPVLVTNPKNGQSVTAKVADTMPHIANIRNGARIDMNSATIAALGLVHPVMATVTWQKIT